MFTPSAPISDQDLFAGRNHEMFSVVEAMQSAGQHAVIYGERGVGKTSLARVCALIGEQQGQLPIRINCEASDDFGSVWVKVADELGIYLAGLAPEQSALLSDAIRRAQDVLTGNVLNANVIRVALRNITAIRPVVIFFDEFNELADSNAIITLANTIKAMSDHIERATLCPVGVAEDLDALLEGHLSAVRAIAQVKMPRMNREELGEIVTRGLSKLGMTIERPAFELTRIVPRGLPQYAHLLAQEGARNALLQTRMVITRDDVMAGLRVGLLKLDRSLTTAYENATYSPRKTRLREVLLACAITKLGDMGDFSPSDIRAPYSKIIGETVGVDRFNPQLTSLATTREILIREGEDRRWRYRFKDPLMEPFVLLQGLDAGIITPADFPH
ncbi:AAA family ATPase [Mycobacteroides abscessus]|uniref:AAA family ATPase n=1 Tax=Mycobacteroides abscessus TaxID=36809 RepID=UPI0002F719FE|nr:ATP-binding protein [Mycobacteroides abscessus]BAP95205.1 putative DNA-binding protein [Mycobacteroides abscessus subsp. massiliense CCUG 48898 = JCM 15300]